MKLATAFPIIGVGCVIAGGLTAAVTAHTPSEHATWAAAYLVLVAGVAQVALGAGQARLADQQPSSVWLIGELATWNLGNALVIAGTVAGLTPLVDIGGLLLVVALALFASVGRRQTHRLLVLYRAVIAVVLVSIPVGLVIANVRGQ